jgi:ribosome maturation factor RimP
MVLSKAETDWVAVVERTVSGLGYEFVDVERVGGLLRVTIDSVGGVRVEDCERVSHQLTHLFAVQAVDYDRLEVGSPGLDRPLRNARDFARFVGAEANVQLTVPIDGRRRLRGQIVELTGAAGAEQVLMRLTPKTEPQPRSPSKRKPLKTAQAPVEVRFALADVEKARLVPELNFRSDR